MADVFISYKRKDFVRALHLIEALEDHGYSVWWDRKLIPGNDWQEHLFKELRKSACVVVMWTSNSINEKGAYDSPHILEETDEALKLAKLVPALLDLGHVLQSQKHLQFADLTAWKRNTDHTGFRALLTAISQFAGERLKPAAAEMDAWRAAEATHSRESFRGFTREFPRSRFVAIANTRIEELALSAPTVRFFTEDDDELRQYYPGARLLTYPLPHSLRQIAYVDYPGLCGQRAARAIVRKETHKWRLPSEVRQITESGYEELIEFIESEPFEGSNARCSGLKARSFPLTTDVLTVQPVGYEDYLRSNIVIDYERDGAQSLRRRVHPGGTLDRFETSVLANTIGINVLIVNAAGQVPVQIRSRAVAFRPHQVCSSASGTFEIGDVPRNGARLSQCDLLREARKELGVGITTDRVTPVIVGLARELARGGQLEIFVVAEVEFDRQQLRESANRAEEKDEWLAFDYLHLERTARGYSAEQIEIAVKSLERNHPGNVAAPLRAHLSLWFRFLAMQGQIS